MRAGGIKLLTPTSLKAGPDHGLAEGEAKAMISVYDVFDSDGDRIKAGEFDAFAETFNSGDAVLPVLFAHQHRDPMMYVGEIGQLDPRAKNEKGQTGMAADVTYDLDGTNPNAAQAYKLAKGRRVNQWSYHWFGEREKAADAPDKFDLKGLGITEASMVLRGANDQTETLDIKAALERGEKIDPVELALRIAKAMAGDKGAKSYVDVDVPGSFEATQDALRAALGAAYPAPAEPNAYRYVNLVATTGTAVTYQVVSETGEGRAEQLYQADYEIADDGTVALGDATEASVAITKAATDGFPKSATEIDIMLEMATLLPS